VDIRYFSAFRAEFLSTADVDNVVGSVVDNLFYVDKSFFTALIFQFFICLIYSRKKMH